MGNFNSSSNQDFNQLFTHGKKKIGGFEIFSKNSLPRWVLGDISKQSLIDEKDEIFLVVSLKLRLGNLKLRKAVLIFLKDHVSIWSSFLPTMKANVNYKEIASIEVLTDSSYRSIIFRTQQDEDVLWLRQPIRGGGFEVKKLSPFLNDMCNEIRKWELIQQLQAPNFTTAKLIQSGNFPDYKTFKKAQALGVENLDQLMLMEKYKAKDYESAVTQSIRDMIITLEKEGKIFLKKYKGITVSNSDTLKIINQKNILGISTEDQSIFLTSKYIRERLAEASKIYSDLEFETVATSLDIPLQYIHELLVAAIEKNMIIGTIDRTNQRLFIREIPISLVEQMIEGRVVSVENVKDEYSKSLEASLNTLQEQLPSSQFVLTRENKFLSVEKIKCGCQICSETIQVDKFLKCIKCNRELCWDHFMELRAVGRTGCPYCDGSLIFLPQFCEKCHIDFIRIPKTEHLCDYCSYTLKVKDNLIQFQQIFLREIIKQTPEKVVDEIADEDKKEELKAEGKLIR